MSYKNPHAPPGMAWCSFCRAYKYRSEFYRNRARPHGLQDICKEHSKLAVCGIRLGGTANVQREAA